MHVCMKNLFKECAANGVISDYQYLLWHCWGLQWETGISVFTEIVKATVQERLFEIQSLKLLNICCIRVKWGKSLVFGVAKGLEIVCTTFLNLGISTSFWSLVYRYKLNCFTPLHHCIWAYHQDQPLSIWLRGIVTEL